MPIFQWLKSLPSTKLCRILGCSLFLLLLSMPILAQNTIEVRINDGQATSTCVDGFGGNAEPLWQVNIENEGWMTYGDAFCHNTTPNTQFRASLDCLGDLRGGEIQVCFKVFENDDSLFDPCKIDMDCEQMICEYFVLPLAGTSTDYDLNISDGLDSGGSLNFTINTDGPQNGAVNDHICHAIDLGTLDGNRAVQEKEDLTTYNNFCATATEEVDPKKIGGSFTNNAGVWFSFNTGDDPSDLILIEAFNDPESTGDIINLQLALYQLDTDCRGEINYITDHHNPAVLDEHLLLECLPPNQEYYLLVDGVFDDTSNPDVPELNGYFSIRIREIEVEGGNDDICGAIPLAVEEGGTTTHTNFFNNCATNINDPVVESYSSLQPVWFQFTPPSTHRAFIKVISNQPYPIGVDAIEPQIAVFSSDDDTCTGSLTRVSHHYENDGLENGLTVECLDPNKTYWIMIDGSEANPSGIFDISITDPGYPDLKKFDAVGCQGFPVILGDQMYTEAGVYIDTVRFESCLEILETTVRFVDALQVDIDIIKKAGGLGVSDGNANVIVTGGSGVNTITWSDGTNEPVTKELSGGTEYCITVVDSIGCTLDTCFVMPYVIPIKAIFKNDTLDCFGDNDGTLVLDITEGHPPYSYELVNVDNGLPLQKGSIIDTTSTIYFENLTAADYKIFLFTATNSWDKSATVLAPKPIDISIINKTEASCHNTCDALIELSVEGGNDGFNFNWSDNINRTQNATDLCGGDYQLTVTDEKQCTATINLTIDQPAVFTAKAIQTKAISCFGDDNGEAMVSTNGNATNFIWDNGDTMAIANDLAAGIHSVIVRNEYDCTDTAFVEIEEPTPLVASIDILSTINCFGQENGLLAGSGTGGNGNLSYLWNNNSTAPLYDNLAAGNYSLTITDAIGCTNNTSIELPQPTAVSALIKKQDVTCPGGPKSGEISIEEPVGGVAPYAYSINGTVFSTATNFNNLSADSYEVSTQDANGCTITETIAINDPPILEVELGEPQMVKLGNTIKLSALTNRPVNYQWNTLDSNCTDCESIEITPTASQLYQVTVTDPDTDCVATDEVFITIDNNRDVYVPNAFSPNGDGHNDALMIYGGNNIKSIKAFKVFDRHGNLVYQADNFAPNDASTSWKGDFNGQRLASALFIYWAEVEFIDGYSDIYKGDIALFR